MYIKRDINIVITDEECQILKKAREILMNFESECTSADENFLQEQYNIYTDCVDHQYALPTAVDLLTVILGDNDL
jgi:hypothetical protein